MTNSDPWVTAAEQPNTPVVASTAQRPLEEERVTAPP